MLVLVSNGWAEGGVAVVAVGVVVCGGVVFGLFTVAKVAGLFAVADDGGVVVFWLGDTAEAGVKLCTVAPSTWPKLCELVPELF